MIEVHVLGDSTMSGKESIIEDELYQENAKEHTLLFRFYKLFSLVNDILLLPMFASIIIENFEHHTLDSIKTGEQTSNIALCVFFFIEWLLGLLLADKKRKYLRTPIKILDLISCLPLGSIVQGGRFIRLLRVIKIFRLITRAKKYNGPGKDLLYVITTVFAVTFSSAYTILLLEGKINPHFENIKDGLWWSFVTITSVGYGDKYPITDAGKFMAILLMIIGVGLCGYIAAWLMNLMSIESEQEDNKRLNKIERELAVMNKNISHLSDKLDSLTTLLKELKEKD